MTAARLHASHKKLADILEKMRDIESISKKLQSDGLTLLDARDLLDKLLKIRSKYARYIGMHSSTIMTHVLFLTLAFVV